MRMDGVRLRQAAVKAIVVAFVVVIAIDTFPLGISSDSGRFSFIYQLKSAIRPALRPIGLWQSEWRLFAPDPVINNCWWTIEVKGKLAEELGELSSTESQLLTNNADFTTWNSPFWGEVPPAAKFFKRRHIAYSRRLSQFPITVIEDFADEWVRERFGNRLHPLGDVPLENGFLQSAASDEGIESEPYVLELNVFRNELKLALPDDGSLPTREDTVWMSVTEKYLQRRYGQ